MAPETIESLRARNQELASALEEATQTLEAIRNGEVDAVVASGPEGDAVYTLRGADEAYRHLVERMAQGAVTLTPDGLILFANEKFAQILCLPLERVMGARFQEFVAPEDRALLDALLSERGGPELELHLRYEEGLVPIYLSAGSLNSGGLECVTLVVTDLTEQKRNETIVADGKLARSILEQAATAIVVLAPDGRIIQANPAAERLAGAAVLLRPFGSAFSLRAGSPARELTFEEILGTAERRGNIASLQASVENPGQNPVPVILNAGLLTGTAAEILGCIITLSDVGGLRRAEEALRASEARERVRAAELNAILEAAPVAVLVSHDAECRAVTGNRSAYEMFRVPYGSNLSAIGSESRDDSSYRLMKDGREISARDLPTQRAALTGQPVRDYECDVVLADGTCRHLLGDAVPLQGEDGLPRGAVGAFIDITERKRTQERLQRSQKLESIGLLAGGIAHDFNNLLTAVLGNASLLLDEVGDSAAERVREIMGSAERAASLTRQLLAYSGKGQFVVRDLDVSEAVHEISGLVQFSIPQNVQLALTIQGRAPFVRMDPGQLQQILMNLVTNAAEAIGEQTPGRVAVSTSVVDVEWPFVDVLGEEAPAGRYAAIEVSDTGCGIEAEDRFRIFDPFFTTKFTGRGLGLAAVAGIVRSLKGAITLETEMGRGSTFRVLLPLAERYENETAGAAVPDGRGTILVVDDESGVRLFIGEVLRRQGYRVLLAPDGREALALLEREDGAVEAAVVDVLMPVMGANDLLPELQERCPDLKILLTSGCSESEARRLSDAPVGTAFLQKPYTAQRLTKAVNQLLGATERGHASRGQNSPI